LHTFGEKSLKRTVGQVGEILLITACPSLDSLRMKYMIREGKMDEAIKALPTPNETIL